MELGERSIAGHPNRIGRLRVQVQESFCPTRSSLRTIGKFVNYLFWASSICMYVIRGRRTEGTEGSACGLVRSQPPWCVPACWMLRLPAVLRYKSIAKKAPRGRGRSRSKSLLTPLSIRFDFIEKTPCCLTSEIGLSTRVDLPYMVFLWLCYSKLSQRLSYTASQYSG